jgi:hypothetical protein
VVFSKRLHIWHVRYWHWLCKYILAEALRPGSPGAVTMGNDFPEFCGFLFWDRLRLGLRLSWDALQQQTATYRGDYALIAAMSGWTPMMFMTRVRL